MSERALTKKQLDKIKADRQISYSIGYNDGIQFQYEKMNKRVIEVLEEEIKLRDRIQELESQLKNTSKPGVFCKVMV